MEAIIVYADGTQTEVDDLAVFAAEGADIDGTESIDELARLIFGFDGDVAEVIYDPNGIEAVYTPSRDDFGAGFGL